MFPIMQVLTYIRKAVKDHPFNFLTLLIALLSAAFAGLSAWEAHLSFSAEYSPNLEMAEAQAERDAAADTYFIRLKLRNTGRRLAEGVVLFTDLYDFGVHHNLEFGPGPPSVNPPSPGDGKAPIHVDDVVSFHNIPSNGTSDEERVFKGYPIKNDHDVNIHGWVVYRGAGRQFELGYCYHFLAETPGREPRLQPCEAFFYPPSKYLDSYKR